MANHKRIERLMRVMGIQAITPGPHTSKPAPGHKIYPYLLRNVEIERVNQVWSIDITYVPMKKGYMYLAAVIEWYSRYVLSWQLSNTMDSSFCIQALLAALCHGRPEIFNSDQGSQSQAVSSQENCLDVRSQSAWMAEAAPWITYLLRGFGGR
jgi:putative transposase